MNLGDRMMETVGIDSEIVSITPKKDGTVEYGGVRVVTRFNEKLKLWEHKATSRLDNARFDTCPLDGACYYAMHKRTGPHHYFFSANPEHIEAARGQHEQARQARLAREQQNRANMLAFQTELHALLKKYNASIYANQTSGDDQGVELEVCYSVGDLSETLEEP